MAAAIGANRIHVPLKDETTPRNLLCLQIATTGIFLGTVAYCAASWIGISVWVGLTVYSVSFVTLALIASVDGQHNTNSTPLQQAALGGHKIWLKFLLFFGANPNKEKSDKSPFAIAYDKGDFESAKLLIDYGADMSAYQSFDAGEMRMLPLQVASIDGRVEIIRKILDKHPNLIHRSFEGSTPLKFACERGLSAAAQLLMDYCAYPVGVDHAGWSLFHSVVVHGRLPIVRMILEKTKRAVIEQKTADGSTPLFLACLEGHQDIVQQLLEDGANINEVNKQRETVLHAAALGNHPELIPMLLKIAPGLFNQKDKRGRTPLYCACRNGSLEAASLLIELGADIYQVNDNGETIFHAVARNPKCTALIPLILKKAPQLLERQTTNGMTPLYLACAKDHQETAICLVSYGADKNAVLFMAAFKGHSAPLRSLLKLQSGDKILEQKTAEGFTPLGLACFQGHVEIVRLLLENGADLSALNGPNECTALHLASLHGHTDVVQDILLKAHPTLLEKTTKQGKTALHLACLRGHRETARLLIVKIANVLTTLRNAAYQGDTKAIQTMLQILPNVVTMVEQKLTEIKNMITPLYLACLQGHQETEQLLLRNGANIGIALCAAASEGDTAMIQFLLDLDPKKRALEQATDGYTPLGWACSKRHVKAAQLLIEQGAEISVSDESEDFTILHLAALYGQTSMIQIILQNTHIKKRVLEQKYQGNLTPLFLACKHNHIAAACMLLSYGADAFAPLCQAASKGNTEVIRMILENVPDNCRILECQTSDGSTPLSLACRHGYVAAVQMLLSNGANAYEAIREAVFQENTATIRLILENVHNKKRLFERQTEGLTLLGWACSRGYLEAAQLFIDHGADINALNGANEYTALHLASLNDHALVIQMILQMSLNQKKCLEQKTKDGFTPLSLAIRHNRPAAVRMLLSNDAFWWKIFHLAIWEDNSAVIGIILENAPDKNNCLEHTTTHGYAPLLEAIDYNPLSLAIEYNRPAAVRMLLLHGANGYGALNKAILEGNTTVIRMILENAPDQKSLLDQKTITRLTPLHLACKRGKLETAQLLLDHGADLNAVQEPTGWTPFHLAVLNKHLPIVRMILEKTKRAVIEQKTADGSTPLFWACQKGHQDIVQLLVESGANINAPHEQALHQACKFGHVPVVRYLLQAGAEICPFPEAATPYSIAASFQQNEVLDLFFEHQERTLRQAAQFIRQGKPSHQSLIYILDCILREYLLRDAVNNSSFEVFYMHRNTKLFSGTFALFQKSTLLTVHLLTCQNGYAETQDCRQLQEIRRSALLINDRLLRIRPIYSFFRKDLVETRLAQNDMLRADYARLAEDCGSKMTDLEIKESELDFDDSDACGLLTEVGLLVGDLHNTAEALFMKKIGVSYKKIGEKKLEEGPHLRNIGITYTLRYLCEGLANDPYRVMPTILRELTRIEEVIRKNVPNPEKLLTRIARLRLKEFSASELKDFHRDYVIAVLKAYLNP